LAGEAHVGSVESGDPGENALGALGYSVALVVDQVRGDAPRCLSTTLRCLHAGGHTPLPASIRRRRPLAVMTAPWAPRDRPARIDNYVDASGLVGAGARERGVRSSVGTPIIIEGRLWGLVGAGSSGEQPLPVQTEARLASFTELLATAIANADSRARIARLAQEQAALRRVATLVARGAPADEVFAAVPEEAGQLLQASQATMIRYESDGTATIVASWRRTGEIVPPVGDRQRLGGRNLTTIISQTRRPACWRTCRRWPAASTPRSWPGAASSRR